MLRYLYYIFCLTVIITVQTFAQTTWVPFLQQTKTKPTTNLTTSNNNTVSFTVQINGMEASNIKAGTSAYQSLSIPDGEVMTKAGSPQVPIISKLIAIPDCDNVSISITPSNELQFPNYNVLPVARYDKKQLPDGSDDLVPVYEENKSIYSSGADFPGKYGEITEIGYVRDQKVVHVAIYPVQFNPAGKMIKAYTNFSVTLSFVNPKSPVNKELGIFRNMMHHAALNYELSGISASTKMTNGVQSNSLSKASTVNTVQGSVTRVTDLSTLVGANAIPVDYLIITVPSLFNSSSLTTLANHRMSYNGYDVAIVEVNDIYLDSKYNAPHDYEEIRNFIADVYNIGKASHTGDGHLGYICLVGDAYDDNNAEMLPAAYPSYYGSLEQAGDYYYACTGGDNDNLQDIMYGRLSVGNETELSTIVNKIINYEANTNGNWNENYSFMSFSPEFYSYADPAITNMTNLIPSTCNKYYAYRAIDTSQPTTVTAVTAPPLGKTFSYNAWYYDLPPFNPDDPTGLCYSQVLNDWLYNQLNNGMHTFVYEGHGGWDALGANEGCGRYIFKSNDCFPPCACDHTNTIYARLTNTFDAFMIFNCCDAGHFDNGNPNFPNFTDDCLSEKLLENVDSRGAIGVLASTRDSYPYAFGRVDEFILDAQYNSLSHIMSEAVMESKLSLGGTGDDLQFRRQYNLYGDPALNLWPTGYTISQNITLSGTNQISENITVASGVTLTISAGAILKFAQGDSLIINGTLNSQGTSTNPISFTSTGSTSPGSWGTIIFNGSGASSSNLNYANITYGTGIKFLNGANATIQNSYIDTCTNGIYVYNSEPQILTNHILEPQQNGIYGEASGMYPSVIDNTIIKTTASGSYYQNYQGIWFTNNTRAYIAHNDVSGFYWGAYISAVAFFTNSNYSLFNPNNRFRNNLYGFAAGWGGYIWGGTGTSSQCYNTCDSNSIYDVESYHNGLVYAENDYWGGGQPKSYVDGTSYLYTTPIISSPDPWGGSNSPAIKQTNNLLSASYRTSANQSQVTQPADSNLSDIFAGISFEKDGRIDDAIACYKNMIANDNNTGFALTELAAINNKYSRNDVLSYFANIPAVNKHYPLALKLIADNNLQNNKFDEAISIYDKLITNYPNDYQGINARFEKLFAYLNIKNDKEKAGQILSDIKAMNLTDQEWAMRTEAAEGLLGLAGNSATKNQAATSNQNNEVNNPPKEYALFANYPNPFNPSTIISYQIPKDGMVTLKVFDALGREVKTLVNGFKSQGRYSVSFDASKLASGVYFYKIESGSFQSVKKMMLLK